MTHRDIPGWFDFPDLYTFAGLRGGRMVEVGAWLGCSSVWLGLMKKLGAPITELHIVDKFDGMVNTDVKMPPDEHYRRFQDNMSACGVLDQMIVHRKESTEAAKDFVDGSLDFVFIDGDHMYNDVKRDILAWRNKLKPDGLLSGHDILEKGVADAVNELVPNFIVMHNCWLDRKIV